MKIAYTAGPYRASSARGIWDNIEAAAAVALELWRMGYAVICPHKNTALFDGAAPDSVWLAGDLEIIKRCDLVVVLPGWETSSGTKAEILLAQSELIPVWYWPEDREQILRYVRDPDPFAEYGEDPVERALAGGPSD